MPKNSSLRSDFYRRKCQKNELISKAIMLLRNLLKLEQEEADEYKITWEEKNINPKTGKVTKFHKDNCSGCSLCEGE